MVSIIQLIPKFSNHSYAIFSMHVLFKEINRPTINLQEGKNYFSGKHHIHYEKVD